ncbi:hypothetical protein D8Y22_12145 [Salinadaptatus halalkaliphilus]|uniref:LWR-salt protein n=1 Tax=Salinadaptatus halalkaliphilus TaxID=2419781 RepID=A0A4S3TKC4_9EURY|nr:LWR-salt protein [Salinadaptatus halalkaliphilus]THE64572.1 hypothetical protein D8Y22_12145 [Salinadaptatus halalkaliphilus]
MEGNYVFRVTLQIEPAVEGVSIEPASAEPTVTCYREAAEPGTEGWLFFRNTLWRGEIADQAYGCDLAEEWLELPVAAVDFRELQVDEAYLEALKTEIAADLDAFNAETVSAVLSKYLGSSIHVRSA